MRQNRNQKLPGRPLPDADVVRLIEVCGKGPSGRRNAALVAVMAGSGLRVSEALALRVSDLEERAPGRWAIYVEHGKGDRSRWTFLLVEYAVHLVAWLRERERLGLTGRAPLFCTISSNSKGRPVSDVYVRQLLPRLAARAGVEQRVHAHALRHTFATRLRRERVDLAAISRALGHASIATTSRYLDRISAQDVADAIWDVEPDG